MSEYKAQIYDVLAKFSDLFEFPPKPQRLHAYCEILSKYEPEKLTCALKTLLRTSDRYPSMYKLLEILDPQPAEKDIAQENAMKILKAARSFSEYDTDGAKKFLGELWEIAVAFQSWAELCRLTSDDIPITRAHLRDFCGAYVRRSKAEERKRELSDSANEMKKIGEVLKS